MNLTLLTQTLIYEDYREALELFIFLFIYLIIYLFIHLFK